jgi:t-SNARE complex subunit (syntaxin)
MPQPKKEEREMSANQENIHKFMEALEPWTQASKAWVAEVEKFQQTAIDNWTKTVDEGYRIAKESIGSFAAYTTNLQKQLHAQLDRANEFMTTFKP